MRYLLTLGFLLIAIPCFPQAARTYTVCESGCDHATVQLADDAHDQDLPANDSILTFEIQNTWTSDETGVSIVGWTMDATRFLTITAVGAARAGATYDGTNAYRTVATTAPFFNSESFLVVDGIQASTTETGATVARCIDMGSAPNCTVKNCFAKGSTGSNVTGINFGAGGTTAGVIRNNIVIDCPLKGIDISAAIGGVKADNNTIENCGIGVETNTQDGIIRNTIFFNVTTPVSGVPNLTTLSEENWTDNASITYTSCGSCGAGDQLSQPDPFVAIGSENYSLASGSTPIDAGKDLSADFSDAIGGKTRTDGFFDKGADELIAAPVGGDRVLIRIGMMFWHYGIEI